MASRAPARPAHAALRTNARTWVPPTLIPAKDAAILVVPHGCKGPVEAAPSEVGEEHENEERTDHRYPGEPVVGLDRARRRESDRNALIRVEEMIGELRGHESQRQRHPCQVRAPQPGRCHTEHRAGDRGGSHRNDQPCDQWDVRLVGLELGVRVRPHGHEGPVPEGELPSAAGEHREAGDRNHEQGDHCNLGVGEVAHAD